MKYVAAIGLVAATLASESSVPTLAQDKTFSTTFEVVSVKEVQDSSARQYRFDFTPGGRLTASNATLEDLVIRAYGLPPIQLVGLPRWARTRAFDVEATAGADGRSPAALPVMLRALLSERFALMTHPEMRAGPVYDLTMANGDRRFGRGLKASVSDCTAWRVALAEWDRSHIGQRPIDASCESTTELRGDLAVMRFRALTISRFAGLLRDWVGRAVEDRTGLQGEFDLEIEVRRGDIPVLNLGRVSPPVEPSDSPTLFTALEEQLGLRLESGKGAIEVLVIDSVALPTPN